MAHQIRIIYKHKIEYVYKTVDIIICTWLKYLCNCKENNYHLGINEQLLKHDLCIYMIIRLIYMCFLIVIFNILFKLNNIGTDILLLLLK